MGRAWVVFALYDSQGREIGRVKEQSIGPIAPGEIWQIRSTTPQPFERFSAIEIKAE
ncbi:FxLYD domain-containing protein [Bordetella pertussis]|uniref:FxLYD domain-containing protein n=1 Tax=Bordetella pertussis TaxID=520 RepID=UPI001E2D0200|nr:FxLYD domain-containing protein [Bordetella pertussis]WDI08849.1 FxLYD domain-containing protein [Bordetella pertussis]WDI12426.1 FxLYD domain-containing protein [Bordetella pertussis]WDI15966.1 FxLYD domain-containing protein [Bordetella pertussis]WIO79283.1 FxLYD domain-containing protein [Bordetella pertussis]WIO82813.1 FxLYD domain-containing protein [Bordetella pertussis]